MFLVRELSEGMVHKIPCSWGNKYRNLALQARGVLKLRQLKYGHELRGLGPRKTALVRPSRNCNYRSILSSERAPHNNNNKNTIVIISKEERIWSQVPKGIHILIQNKYS
jgi:hypothetical protein